MGNDNNNNAEKRPESGVAEEKHHFTLRPHPAVTVSTPNCACGEGSSVWPNHKVPIWKIPFPNHLGPTLIAILPHKERQAIYCKNHQRQGSKPKFRHEELPSGV